MTSTQQRLIDSLIRNLYSTDPPYNVKDQNTVLGLQLSLISADNKRQRLLTRAHELIEKRCITVNILKEDGDSWDYHTSLVVIKDADNNGGVMVDLDQWFCSCSGFTTKLQATTVTSAKHDTTVQYGHRSCPSDIQFDYNLQDDNGRSSGGSVPVCEHLLAALLLRTYPAKFHDYINTRLCTQHEYALLMTTL